MIKMSILELKKGCNEPLLIHVLCIYWTTIPWDWSLLSCTHSHHITSQHNTPHHSYIEVTLRWQRASYRWKQIALTTLASRLYKNFFASPAKRIVGFQRWRAHLHCLLMSGRCVCSASNLLPAMPGCNVPGMRKISRAVVFLCVPTIHWDAVGKTKTKYLTNMRLELFTASSKVNFTCMACQTWNLIWRTCINLESYKLVLTPNT